MQSDVAALLCLHTDTPLRPFLSLMLLELGVDSGWRQPSDQQQAVNISAAFPCGGCLRDCAPPPNRKPPTVFSLLLGGLMSYFRLHLCHCAACHLDGRRPGQRE